MVEENNITKPEISESIKNINGLQESYNSIPKNELQKRSDALKEIRRRINVIVHKMDEEDERMTELRIIKYWLDVETIKLTEAMIVVARNKKSKSDDRDEI